MWQGKRQLYRAVHKPTIAARTCESSRVTSTPSTSTQVPGEGQGDERVSKLL